ncbi:hypothetical protein ABZW95_34575, partial [Streptomyces sp. NPDC004579]
PGPGEPGGKGSRDSPVATKRQKEVDAMGHWEIRIPTRLPGQEPQTGVQVFTYPAAAFPFRGDAIEQARVDVGTDRAIRHRRQALADVTRMQVVWHDKVSALF